mmetsp:Transcript_4141/g.12051  ORF Transcript_4141/g.12051 Transcript_4141/m.12051 type:complete len:207 (-) Transcript_4141:2454-3074(-)
MIEFDGGGILSPISGFLHEPQNFLLLLFLLLLDFPSLLFFGLGSLPPLPVQIHSRLPLLRNEVLPFLLPPVDLLVDQSGLHDVIQKESEKLHVILVTDLLVFLLLQLTCSALHHVPHARLGEDVPRKHIRPRNATPLGCHGVDPSPDPAEATWVLRAIQKQNAEQVSIEASQGRPRQLDHLCQLVELQGLHPEHLSEDEKARGNLA